MLNITINEQAGRLIAALVGDLDNAASSQAKRGIEPVFERKDCDVVIDCTQLNYISSSGLRIVLDVFKHTRSNGHKVILKNLSEDVKEVFELSGFLQLFIVE
jgi:anti-sigma B factor antagonist